MKIKCIICGNDFEGRSRHLKCCSYNCSKINKKHWTKTYRLKEEVKQREKESKYKYNNSEKGKIKNRIREKNRPKTLARKISKHKSELKRRALKNNCIHKDYSAWLKEVKSLNKFTCYWCNKVFKINKLTLDHVIPLSKGGSDTKDNLVPCCMQCNRLKHAKLPEQFNSTLKQPRLII